MVTEALSSVPIHFSILKLKFLCYPHSVSQWQPEHRDSLQSQPAAAVWNVAPGGLTVWGGPGRPAVAALLWWNLDGSVQFSSVRAGAGWGRAGPPHITSQQPHSLTGSLCSPGLHFGARTQYSAPILSRQAGGLLAPPLSPTSQASSQVVIRLHHSNQPPVSRLNIILFISTSVPRHVYWFSKCGNKKKFVFVILNVWKI